MWQPKQTSTPTFTRPLTPIETHIETPSFTHTQTHILKNHPDSYLHTLIHTQIIHLLYSPTQKCSHSSPTHSLMLLLTHTYYPDSHSNTPILISKDEYALSHLLTDSHIQHRLTYSNTLTHTYILMRRDTHSSPIPIHTICVIIDLLAHPRLILTYTSLSPET